MISLCPPGVMWDRLDIPWGSPFRLQPPLQAATGITSTPVMYSYVPLSRYTEVSTK
jgi:hypothetical protein